MPSRPMISAAMPPSTLSTTFLRWSANTDALYITFRLRRGRRRHGRAHGVAVAALQDAVLQRVAHTAGGADEVLGQAGAGAQILGEAAVAHLDRIVERLPHRGSCLLYTSP